MSRYGTLYVCRACGQESLRWAGRCPACAEWNTLEERAAGRRAGGRNTPAARAAARRLSEEAAAAPRREESGIAEFDRLLGGGIVSGSFILIGGEPGIGKSTLMLQVAARLAGKGRTVLYAAAEESFEQTRLRAARLGAGGDNLFVLPEPNVCAVLDEARRLKADILIADSIQIVFHPDIPSTPGSVSQVRESAAALMKAAKEEGMTVFVVGQVTKSGDIAGPRLLEHMVDTVLYFEGDRYHTCRILRTQKNRFGSTQEVGVFEMGSGGLEEVESPSRLFLRERRPQNAGSVVTPAMEGTRPILVEIQALVGARTHGIPQKKSIGLDYNRLCMLLAVLEQRAGLSLRERDVFVSVAGGLAVGEPAVDLAIALAVASAATGKATAEDTVAVGEVGLGGELRGCQQMERRLREAGRLGFRRAVVSRSSGSGTKEELCGVRLLQARTVSEAITILPGVSSER